MRNWGEERRYEHAIKGFNYRMDGIQGAILRVKLQLPRAMDGGTTRTCRVLRARAGRARASDCRRNDLTCRHVYHVFAVRAAAA